MALVKYNNNSISAITTAGQLALGSMVLIKEQTASSSASISFVDESGGVVLDSTYPIYKFEFVDIHPANAGTNFRVNFSTDSGSNYNVTKTTTVFKTEHHEDDSGVDQGYETSQDLAQSTNPQMFMILDNANDSGGAGELFLFNPSSTTFVKHFMANGTGFVVDGGKPKQFTMYVAGYGNTTSAIDGVQFSMASGNIDAGTIKLYGIKGS